jgi:hypothetical protein
MKWADLKALVLWQSLLSCEGGGLVCLYPSLTGSLISNPEANLACLLGSYSILTLTLATWYDWIPNVFNLVNQNEYNTFIMHVWLCMHCWITEI